MTSDPTSDDPVRDALAPFAWRSTAVRASLTVARERVPSLQGDGFLAGVCIALLADADQHEAAALAAAVRHRSFDYQSTRSYAARILAWAATALSAEVPDGEYVREMVANLPHLIAEAARRERHAEGVGAVATWVATAEGRAAVAEVAAQIAASGRPP